MTVRAGKLNGKNLNYIDHDNSALDYALIKSGVIEGLEVTTNSVGVGRAIIITKRTSVTPNQKFGVHVEITATETIVTSGTKKVWLELDPTYINDGTLATNALGTQIAKVNTGASWPADSAYFIKLASITGGVITDERQFIKEMFFNLDVPLNQAPSIDIESATITDLSNMTGDSADITGTETIENFGTMPEGAIKYLTFQDILEIVHDDISNILPNDGANITTAVGDVAVMRSLGGGNWKCISYMKADGTALSVATVDPKLDAVLDETFYPGEDITAGDALFVEPGATFAASTTVQAIGDVTGRTRFEIPGFGSGVAGSTVKLSLRKYVSPSVALGIRIETDNAGNPSGTLVHANATGTVSAASLSTSLADTTVTLGGSFTITAGQKVHIVLFQGTYGSETINATNYYGVGYSTNNTTTRGLKLWDGTTWAAVYSSVGSTNATLAGSSPQNRSSTAPLGLQYLAINDVIINTITKDASTAATKAYIKNDAGTILDTMTFSGNTATPTKIIVFPAGTYFRIEVDNNGSAFTNRREQWPTTYPQVGTDISITSNSLSGVNDPVDNQNNSIITINTGIATPIANFPYASSALFLDEVLSKTDSDYSYKVDWVGISSETAPVGTKPKVTISGINSNKTGITRGSTYYLNATPGSIGTSAGTNSKKIAKGWSSTKVQVIPLAI